METITKEVKYSELMVATYPEGNGWDTYLSLTFCWYCGNRENKFEFQEKTLKQL